MSATKARARNRNAGRRQGLPLFPIAIGAIVVLGVVAIVLTVSGGDDDGSEAETRPVTISGSPLPTMPDDGSTDPAIGMAIPDIKGEDFTGKEVEVEDDGRAKVIAFVAHWCPHCQKEVPVISAYLDDTGMPEGVDLYFVSTSVDSGQGNYPPSAWLKREGVGDVPTVVDDAKTKAYLNYGAGGFPFIVFVDKDNKVALRTTGELPAGSYDQYFNALASGAPLAGSSG